MRPSFETNNQCNGLASLVARHLTGSIIIIPLKPRLYQKVLPYSILFVIAGIECHVYKKIVFVLKSSHAVIMEGEEE